MLTQASAAFAALHRRDPMDTPAQVFEHRKCDADQEQRTTSQDAPVPSLASTRNGIAEAPAAPMAPPAPKPRGLVPPPHGKSDPGQEQTTTSEDDPAQSSASTRNGSAEASAATMAPPAPKPRGLAPPPPKFVDKARSNAATAHADVAAKKALSGTAASFVPRCFLRVKRMPLPR